ncbi:neuronal-specific septin-3 isoform X2 [Nannospalax galili]|uniref:neuronal-specific septin-3 isoform X2 n=1 Tax=Nannospalax galili TaxID=1026970 RepID=UPI00111BEA34|nr:neuronal-specific septin-3 isoform X2 [Nannospalax galili]
MDHDFVPVPPEMQPHRTPGPRTSFSRSHMLGRHTHPRLTGEVSPLIPVIKKAVHLDAFSQSHVLQTSSQPGLRTRARSMPAQGTHIVSGASLNPLPTNNLVPRKLSSITLTIRQNIQAQPVDSPLSHGEELPNLGKEAATYRERKLSTSSSPSTTLWPEVRVSSECRGNQGFTKPNRMPTGEKLLVSSHLALPFQSQFTQNSSSLAGSGPVGQAHIRASPGRGKSRSRGIPRSRACLQRATSPMDLSTVGTKLDVARNLGTMANRPELPINMATPNPSRLGIGAELPTLEAKMGTAMDLSTAVRSGKVINLAKAGPSKSGPDVNLIGVESTKPGKVMNLATTDPDKLGNVVRAGTATLDMTTGVSAVTLSLSDPVNLGISRLGTATVLARTNITKLGTAMDSFALDTSGLDTVVDTLVTVSPELATIDNKLDSANNLIVSDTAVYPLMPSRSTDPAQDDATGDATTDRIMDLASLDLARESKGFPETRTDAAMSELVPEPRPKPAVPMKPVSINSNLLGYIGIDTIIEQMRKKTMKTGFDFNIMVVGQSGLGKSTLVNTLFKSQVSRKASSWNREEKIPKTVEIKAIGHVIEEGGVKMKLTVIDTPGFGDQINNENCWEPIEKYINEQYEKFLKEEVNIARKKRIPDTRVHCCLYFISPTGHSLRPLDLEFMKHLSKVVNIIPVIAKADTMTLEEKSEFKQRVRKELEVNGIEFYPQKEFDEDLEDKTENDKIRQESMPFAVVGSDREYQVNGKRVLGRKTPWGIIEVENLNHCEFALLRDFVIRTHLQDLKEVTHNIHYETYRAKRLNDNGGLPPGEGLLGTVLPPVPATPCPTAE